MRRSYLRIFTPFVLVAYLVSGCATARLAPLPKATRLLISDEPRKVGIWLSPSLSEWYISTILVRVHEFFGWDAELVPLKSNPKQGSHTALRERGFTDLIIIDVDYNQHDRGNVLTKNISGTITVQNISLGEGVSESVAMKSESGKAQRGYELRAKDLGEFLGELIALPFVCPIVTFFAPIYSLGGLRDSEGRTMAEEWLRSCLLLEATPPNYNAVEPKIDHMLLTHLDGSVKQAISKYAVFEDKSRQPPTLVAAVTFNDRNGVLPNNILDAGERANLVIKIENRGNGPAYVVTPVVTGETKGFTMTAPEPLQRIPPNESREVRIPVLGGFNLLDGRAKMLIEVKEKREYDARKVPLSFPTAHLEKPNLSIEPPRIQDGTKGMASGNDNGKIENGETVELQVFVENTGVGEAYGARLSLLEISPSGVEIVQKESDIGLIGINETAKANVVIRIPRNVQLSGLEAKFRVEEIERKAAQTEKRVAFTGATLKPELSTRVEWNDNNGILETGKTIKGILTVHNGGSLAAENVEVALRLTGRGVQLTPQRFQVGRLEPNQTSAPLYATLTISRTFEASEIVINTTVQQQDFPKVEEHQTHAVTLRRPNLVVMQRLTNQVIGNEKTIGSIRQGENTKIEIRVRNQGNMDADGVTISVLSKRPEVQLIGREKTFKIGRIPAGQNSEPIQIPLTILRSAPVEVAEIVVEVSQDDFPDSEQKGVLMVQAESAEEIKIVGEATKEPKPVVQPSIATNPIVIVSPQPSEGIVQDTFNLIWDEVGDVASVEVRVNGDPIDPQPIRGITLTEKAEKQGPRHRKTIPLKLGKNTIVLIAYDLANKRWEDEIVVTRLAERGEIWAAVIGISSYNHVPSLEYARKDADAFLAYLKEYMDVPSDHIRTLYDSDATVQNMKSTLGTWLKEKTGKNDTVFIYYAGHGAPEANPESLDGDGLEKYLLPTEANPADLFSTAFPM